MKLFQLIKLGNADFRARRKTVLHTTIAASIPFIVLFTINLTVAGVENVLLRESGRVTDDEVYLLVGAGSRSAEPTADTDSRPNSAVSLTKRFGGEILAELNAEDAANFTKPMAYFADLANVDLSKATLSPTTNIVHPTPDSFKLVDLALDGIYYFPPTYNTEELIKNLGEQRRLLVKFPSVAKAFNFTKYIQDNYLNIGYDEPFTNLVNIYSRFHNLTRGTKFIQIMFVVIALIIVISSFVYLLDQNIHSMVVYRTLGANTRDLLVISLTYLLEVGLCIIVFSMVVSTILALIFSLVSADYLTGVLTEFYNYKPTSVLLWGWSVDMMIVRFSILAAAPISLLLMLDQFSIQSLTKKLKRG